MGSDLKLSGEEQGETGIFCLSGRGDAVVWMAETEYILNSELTRQELTSPELTGQELTRPELTWRDKIRRSEDRKIGNSRCENDKNMSCLHESEREMILQKLCPGHRKELQGIRPGKGWDESAAAELLLQRWAAQRDLVSPETWNWRRGAHGKPEIPELLPMQFNLTHSDGWVACAFAGWPVGVDLQRIGPVRESVARRFFAAREREMLESAEDREETFTGIWTVREAWGKWTGTGITGDPAAMGYRWEPESGIIYRHEEPVCYVDRYTVNGMALAVCGAPVIK